MGPATHRRREDMIAGCEQPACNGLPVCGGALRSRAMHPAPSLPCCLMASQRYIGATTTESRHGNLS